MRLGVNRVTLIGEISAEPESKTLPSGIGVCDLRVATVEVYTDKQRQTKERTDYHKVVCYQRLADVSAHLQKGAQVFVEGRLQTRSWDDKKDGTKRYITEIIASDIKPFGDAIPFHSESKTPPKPYQAPLAMDDDNVPF